MPSPKFHNQDVGVPVDKSVKLIIPVQLLVLLAEKFAIGKGVTAWQPKEVVNDARAPPVANNALLRAYWPLVNIYMQASSV